MTDPGRSENAAVGAPASAGAADRRGALSALIPLGIVAAVLVSFSPVWNCDFVNWDDDRNFLDNLGYRGLSLGHLRWMFTSFAFGHYQPLSWMTLAADYTLWGMQPRGYHVTNLILHTANALLVYVLAQTLVARASGPPTPAARMRLRLAAAAAALVFAIHPLRVESVAWVTERRDVLSGFFLLLTVLTYLRMVDARPARAWRAWFAVAFGCYVLSLLSKAWGMTLPAVLLVLDAYPLRRFTDGHDRVARIVAEKLPFLALAVVAMVLAAHAQTEMRPLAEHGAPARAMQAAYGLVFYVWKTLLPVSLSPLYLLRPDFNPTAPVYLECAAAVVGVTLVLTRLRRQWPWALTAWLAYAVIVSPVLGVAQSGPQLVADRYTYLACLPWALLFGAAVYRLPSRHRSLGAVLVGGALLTLAALTFRQTRVWTNGGTLWDHVLRLDPTNYVANVNRGYLQLQHDDLDAALASYVAALQANPRYADAYRNRGVLRHRRGDLPGAIADYTTALEIDPTVAAYFNRGMARQAAGDDAGGIADYTAALAGEMPNADALSHRGFLRQKHGDLRGAAADYTAALAIDPTNATTNLNRGVVRQALGDDDGAIADYTAALEGEATRVQAYSARGFLRQNHGDLQGAIADDTAALALDPANIRIYFNRGLARHALGDADGAIADYSMVVQAVANPQAYNNRGLLRGARGDQRGAIEDFERALQVAPPNWPNRPQVEEALRQARTAAVGGS